MKLLKLEQSEATNILDAYPPQLDSEQSKMAIKLKELASHANKYRTTLEYMSKETWVNTVKVLNDLDKETSSLINSNDSNANDYNANTLVLNNLKMEQIDYNRIRNTIDEMNKLIATLNTRLGDLKTDNAEYLEIKAKLEKDLRNLESKKLDTDTINKINNEKAEKEKELRKIAQITSDLRDKIEELEGQLAFAAGEKRKLENLKQQKLLEMDLLHKEKSNLLISPIKSVKVISAPSSPVKVVKHKKGDLIDELMVKFMNEHDLKIRFEQVSSGKYKYATKIVNVKIQNEHAMVRVGGGWISLLDFVSAYEEDELKKIKFYTIGENVSSKVGTPKNVKLKSPRTGMANSKSEWLFTTNTTSNLKNQNSSEKKFGISPRGSPLKKI